MPEHGIWIWLKTALWWNLLLFCVAVLPGAVSVGDSAFHTSTRIKELGVLAWIFIRLVSICRQPGSGYQWPLSSSGWVLFGIASLHYIQGLDSDLGCMYSSLAPVTALQNHSLQCSHGLLHMWLLAGVGVGWPGCFRGWIERWAYECNYSY